MHKARLRLASTLAFATLGSLAWGQTQELFHIDRPAAFTFGWGGILVSADDLDGDGTPDLLVGRHTHGGGLFASVHSGRTGTLLYTLNAPFAALFFGDSMATVADHNSDGVPDIIALGAPSGSHLTTDGVMHLFSGADGSLLQSFLPPTGMRFWQQIHAGITLFDDVDGDGRPEYLCRTYVPPASGPGMTLFSSASGQALFSIEPANPNQGQFAPAVHASDHDGDGHGDIAIVVHEGGVNQFALHSSVTGALITTLPAMGIQQGLSNGEPLLSCADADGDGLRDFVIGGGAFTGVARQYSSADGSVLQEWACAVQPIPCLGNRILELEDVSGDGHPDLLALETDFNVSDHAGVFGLDPIGGDIFTQDHLSGVSAGYIGGTGMLSMPGADPLGFPAFAIVASEPLRVSVRRVLPQLGDRHCLSVPNSTGIPASIHALGSFSVAAGNFMLQLRNAPPEQFGVFVYGSEPAQVPYGIGFLCVGGNIGRLQADQVSHHGELSQTVDLSTFFDSGVTGSLTFQAVFRDSVVGGFVTSDAVTVQPLH